MEYFYTDERNAQIVISLLKGHGIKKAVVSPGTTNICLVASMQQDPFFEMYSAADERSAGYIACGLAAESGEPVLLSCTGATASRNYMPAMTEAYYRKLPILVITSSRRNYRIGHNMDQITDRTQLPKDVAKLSVQMPLVYDKESEWACMIAANKAMLELNHHGMGPVHINLETNYSKVYDVKTLPKTNIIKRYDNLTNLNDLPKIKAKKVVIMVGAHKKWSEELTDVVDKFCAKYNAIVLSDHISNYKGEYRTFAYLLSLQKNYNSIIKNAELMIHIGDVNGSNYGINAEEVWRVNPDGELRDTYGKLKNVFEMEEYEFFEKYVSLKKDSVSNTFYEEVEKEIEKLYKNIPDLPFSNAWVAYQTAKKLPSNSVLHLGIQNSLRFWNFFDTKNEVLGYCNTGGFGIDGSISSTIGASLYDKDKIYYCVLGDLAFFYDLNSLGNKNVGKNIRILLVNNGKGTEFKLSGNPGYLFGDDADKFIAAGGHYGSKSKDLVKHYAQDLGFEYLSASNKEEYLKNLDKFLDNKIYDKPIIFEIFTESSDENKSLTLLTEILEDKKIATKNNIKNVVKNVIGEKGIKNVKKFIEK